MPNWHVQVNTTPHQVIIKEGRHGKHDKPLSVLLSLTTNIFLATIWKVFPAYMSFMASLAKRRKCKKDVFYVTFMPPWRHLIRQANDVKEAFTGRQPMISYPIFLLVNCIMCFVFFRIVVLFPFFILILCILISAI